MATGPRDQTSLSEANELRRRSWAKEAPGYDKRMGFIERRVLGPTHRSWACSQTTGKTLEVAIGTGLNLASYPVGVELVGLDLSPEMLTLFHSRPTRSMPSSAPSRSATSPTRERQSPR